MGGFFKQNKFLVGLSLDGPKSLHDAYRVNKRGDGSFDGRPCAAGSCLRAARGRRQHPVHLHAANADRPLDVYRFFRDELKAEFIQFIPIVERATAETLALANQGWGDLHGRDRPTVHAGRRPRHRALGDAGAVRAVPHPYFRRVGAARRRARSSSQTFDVALGSWLGQHNLCIVSPTCGQCPGARAQRRPVLL